MFFKEKNITLNLVLVLKTNPQFFSIGYPVVTLGFGFKSYVGYRMKQRRQKEIQKENETYYSLLREVSDLNNNMLQL